MAMEKKCHKGQYFPVLSLFSFHMEKSENFCLFSGPQFNLQEESLLKEFSDLKVQLSFRRLSSCFGTGPEEEL